jgi:putative addiction module component (TIGR02574 family)
VYVPVRAAHSTVAIEALLQEVLKMPAEERAELVEHLIDSLDDDQVQLSAEEMAQLDEAIVDADRGELIPADAVLAQMRQIS